AAPILDENFWKNAVVMAPQKKIATSVRLDRDVLEWFRAKGKGYQTRINAVLRGYMQAHER
ncbi:MAG TPA: BrnA antitoxin family protein, partial [Micropepsaceae bacterium]|nr:BrnA antitoxin family protein [Micropepsaceae bacterium]